MTGGTRDSCVATGRTLALLGASGHGKVVADAALEAGWTHIDFFDDRWPALADNGRWRVSGNAASLLAAASSYDGVLVTIGNCAIRLRMQQGLVAVGASMATVVHPRATVSRFATLGAGSVVMAGAVINADAVIGECNIINTGATVDHDCVLSNGVHVSPGAHLAGNVAVGTGSWVGIGAAVCQGVEIGEGVMVGAGAVVVSRVSDGETVVGVPAAPIRRVGEAAGTNK